jgi:imidazolonepropionase-like amidohydrolase
LTKLVDKIALTIEPLTIEPILTFKLSDMKKRIFIPVFIFFSTVCSAQKSLMIKNVGVIDVKAGKVNKGQTVVITGNKIVSVSNKVIVPNSATIIDGSGKYLIPGLWDMHAHALLDSTYIWVFPLLVANGVTGIRDMGNNLQFGQINQIRHDILQGKMLGPRLGATTAKILDGVKAGQSAVSGAALTSNSTAIKTPEEARELVREYKQQRMDFIKPYNHLSREEYLAVVDEAKRQNIPFAGHVPNSMTAAEVSDLGQSSIEHNWDIFVSCSRDEVNLRQELEKIPYNQPVSPARAEINRKAIATYDRATAMKVFAHFVRNSTWMCPTIVFFTPIAFQENDLINDQRLEYIPKYLQTIWHNQFRQRSALNSNEEKKLNDQRRLEIVGLMDSVGVGLLAGTDLNNAYVFPGFSVHEELENFVKAGLSPAAALRTATLNPAKFLKATDLLGTIEKGKIADMVLLDANPLENISNTKKIYAVVVNGKLFERKDLDQMLDKVKELAAK